MALTHSQVDTSKWCSDEPLANQVRGFCEELERSGRSEACGCVRRTRRSVSTSSTFSSEPSGTAP